MANDIFAGYGDLPRQMAQLSLQQQQVQQTGELQRAQMAAMPARTAYLQAQTAAMPLRQQILQEQIKGAPARRTLLAAQAAQAQAQAKHLGAPDLKNPLALLKMGRDLYNKDPKDPKLPVLGQMLANLTAPKHGISIGSDAQGRPSIQIGGQQMFPGTSPFGTPTVNPMTKAARGSKGATYVDNETGKIYSSPTPQETTKLQQAVLTDKQINKVSHIMTDALGDVDYFNPVNHLEAWSSPLTKKWFPEVADKASGLLGIKNVALGAAERLLTMLNMHGTDENVQRAIAVFLPSIHENIGGYEKRIRRNIRMFAENADLNKKALQKGVQVGTMPYRQVQIAPKSFMDFVHPHYEYVHNSDHVPAAGAPAPGAPAPVTPGVAAPAAPQVGPAVGAPVSPAAVAPAAPQYSQTNLEYTAKLHGMTVDELRSVLEKRRAGAQ